MKDLATLLRRAEAGNVAAQAAVGLRYFYGDGTAIDFAEALRFLSSASARGASRATVHLAHIYRRGLGIPGDLDEAIRLYEVASEQGEFVAQIELARIYSSGAAGTPDLVKAAQRYQRALEQAPRIQACEELEEARQFLARAK